LSIHILSNGEKFADINFTNKFIELVKGKNVTVTTTFHSYKAEEHEQQNGVEGSFIRSLTGLKLLDKNGIQISLKHCITKYNYKDLKKFIKFLVSNFSPKAELQFWGIDFCGIDKRIADKYFIKFEGIKPYIEEAIDYFEKNNINRNQILTINNLPLCMCDCYYWTYFSLPNFHYIDHLQEGSKVEANYGTNSLNCIECPFSSFCKGTYVTAFDLYGNNIVKEPKEEKQITKCKTNYIRYNNENLSKLYFSIYDEFYLTPKGFTIVNKKNKFDINIRLKAKELILIINKFNEGIEKKEIINIIKGFSHYIDAEALINDWMIKGIIE